ncbi:MAG: 7-cyano-7-deazaguanine reductase [Azoarcus sp.]|uniref:NADPH-dependent 7-cyano-7-deazaguanine reductase n=1 Tax=Aromatoleum tolulyticum TaxID=34027 RepID=A0A1N6Z784_9RHOO|nr:NADPH-dependent 7-cyano-7-deazaguanine reductase QueF [Aromatoleum tolulyticum]MCK9986997.1 7-cyano-7-deazaguanine reductase [Azoarcus sp.]SIR22722.1 7-cyano-7-deazaguanine reductase [Aromatoleum tolulyticum]
MNPSAPSAHGAESSPLGKPADYCDTYSPALLFPIARQIKRDEIGIVAGKLPFVGEDLWNAYELSWLNPRGKPVVALATFRVPADSPRLIESKSLKLYLNSCNQTRFDGEEAVRATFVRDLSEAAGAPVAVDIRPLGSAPERVIAPPPGESLDELDIDIDTYQPCPDFLSSARDGSEVSETLHSHLLKSNCLVTGQPDWGCIVVRYTGPAIDRAGLLRYIVSFRKHNEFHEQCVERVFSDLLQRCTPRELAVWARYTRRGGLDINPFRSTGQFPAPDNRAEIRQ